MRVPCNLRRIRERRDLTIRDVAERSGINRGSLSALERGRTVPPDSWIPKLERAYGVQKELFYPREVLLVLRYPENATPEARS